MTPDIQKSILRACGRFIRKTLEPIEKRLADIETKSMEGEITAIVSKLLTSAESRSLFETEARQAVSMHFSENPVRNGEDGKDATPVDVSDVVAELLAAPQVKTLVDLHVTEAVSKHFEANPVRDGEDGKDALPLEISDVVAELLVAPEIKTLVDLHVAEAVTTHFQENPVQNGKDAEPITEDQISTQVKAYLAANPPEPGTPGTRGADGVGVAGAVIDRDGSLILTLTNGEAKSLGTIVGRDGTNGTNGKDGLSFESATGQFDAERGFVIRLANAERTAEFVIPYMRHGGFWSEGKAACAGESMTHDGALWIAKRETKAKPCAENSEDWILAARKGRDGRDGRNGIDKTVPVKVVNGNG